MKKFVFIMPLMAISLLVNCGGSNTPQTIEHFVSFDSKGGDHVNTQRVKDGESAKEPDPAPKKTDYTFGGWYLNEDLSGDAYDFSKSVTGDITLFAKWTGGPQPVIPTYTIDFQGENCTSTLDLTKQYHTGDPVSFNINITDTSKYKLPEKINVSGVSKFDYSNQTGAVSFTVESKDIGVIAKASTIDPAVQHTVTFVLNGATSGPIEPVKVNDGDPYPNDKIPANPTNPGHTFEGWSKNEKTKDIVDLTKAPTINSDLILYAWWGNAQSVKITFDANGGYFDDTPSKTTTDVDTPYGQIPVAPTPKKVVAGQTSTFKGWDKTLEPAKPQSEGGTTVYNAVWGDVVNKCHVTFNANGGTITAGGNPLDVDYGSTIASTYRPTVTRSGYDSTDVEWYDAATGGNLFTFGTTEVTTNLTLYAHWGSIKTYTVVFDADGGTYSETSSETVTRENVPYNTMPTIPAAPTKVDSTGVITYTFTGYDKNVVPVSGDDATITYTAKWSEVTNKCHVTFDGNGGTITSGGDPVDVTYGDKINTAPTVVRDGYGETTGWYDAPTGGNKFTFGTTEVTTNLTLYAHWGEIITHKITITGDHIQSGNPLTFVNNKFDAISYTVSVENGYKLTGGYSVNPANSAIVKFTDTKTINITPKINDDITITLGTEEDIKYYYSITTSGQHISYFKDEAMTIPLSHVAASIEEDLVFYMIGDYEDNVLYSPPSSLNVKAGDSSIPCTINDISAAPDKIVKKAIINKENITGNITINSDAIRANYSVTASGEKMKYFKDEAMTIPLNESTAYIYEDFTFYMISDYEENSEGYIPPTSLDIKAGNVIIQNYIIESVTGAYQNVMKKVTIKKEGITGNINIVGDAAIVNYYKIETPYFFGLEPIAEQKTYFEYGKDAAIKLQGKTYFGNPKADRIFVNLTGGEEPADWISPADETSQDKIKFENNTLTIYADVVEASVNTIQIVAWTDGINILDQFDWEGISQLSDSHLAERFFQCGFTKTTEGKTFRIIGFNHDYLADGSGKAGITFECIDSLGNSYWDDDDNYNFPASTLNTALKEDSGSIYNAMPEEILPYIKTVTKSVETNSSYTPTNYDTKLFPLSYDEIDGDDSGTYEYYKIDSQNRRMKGFIYWLRSPSTNNDALAKAVKSDDGSIFDGNVYAGNYYVCPAFCI